MLTKLCTAWLAFIVCNLQEQLSMLTCVQLGWMKAADDFLAMNFATEVVYSNLKCIGVHALVTATV